MSMSGLWFVVSCVENHSSSCMTQALARWANGDLCGAFSLDCDMLHILPGILDLAILVDHLLEIPLSQAFLQGFLGQTEFAHEQGLRK